MDKTDTSGKASPRWLAYELHDGLLQWVIGSRMQVVAGLSKLSESPTPEEVHKLRENLLSAKSNLETALVEARALIRYLEQAQINSATFIQSLAEFVDSILPEAQQAGQTIELSIDPQACPNLSARVCWNFLRIAQQAITNAVRHAGPTSVSVGIAGRDGRCELTVADQGVGFDPEKLVESQGLHFGISSMRHRANLIGGELEISSQPGDGCVVVCRL